MLSQVVAIKARSIGQLEHFQSFFVCCRLATTRFVEPVKESEPYGSVEYSSSHVAGRPTVYAGPPNPGEGARGNMSAA
jgi:hypothetical protein